MDNMIGQRIRNRRKELHITQTQIYSLTGISSGNLSDIENGKSMPSSAAVIQLSKVLDCSTDYILLGFSRTDENPDNASNETELLKYYRTLPADDQEELLILAEAKYKKVSKQKGKQNIEASLSSSQSNRSDEIA